MAKAKKKYRRSRSPKIPMAVVVGTFPLIASIIRGWRAETFRGAGKESLYALTGIDIDNQPHFNPAFMVHGTIPLVGGVLVHKFIGGSLGVNRALGRAHIPFIRI